MRISIKDHKVSRSNRSLLALVSPFNTVFGELLKVSALIRYSSMKVAVFPRKFFLRKKEVSGAYFYVRDLFVPKVFQKIFKKPVDLRYGSSGQH